MLENCTEIGGGFYVKRRHTNAEKLDIINISNETKQFLRRKYAKNICYNRSTPICFS